MFLTLGAKLLFTSPNLLLSVVSRLHLCLARWPVEREKERLAMHETSWLSDVYMTTEIAIGNVKEQIFRSLLMFAICSQHQRTVKLFRRMLVPDDDDALARARKHTHTRAFSSTFSSRRVNTWTWAGHGHAVHVHQRIQVKLYSLESWCTNYEMMFCSCIT